MWDEAGESKYSTRCTHPSTQGCVPKMWTRRTQRKNAPLATLACRCACHIEFCTVHVDTCSLLTWSFVADEAIARCPRHTAEACIISVACQNFHTGRGGSPKAAIDRDCFQRGCSAEAVGMLHELDANRNVDRFLQRAPLAGSPATVAGNLVGISTRLQQSNNNTRFR